jgi:Fe-S cluster biogenesis protein NfuA
MEKSMDTQYTVDLEFTPNPNTLKYVVSQTLLLAGAENFKTPESAKDNSLLATELFSIQGITQVMVGKNFVTITLGDQDSLTELNDQIIETIKNFLKTGRPAVNPDYLKKKADLASQIREGDPDSLDNRIQKILDDEIRPAVAMDGGDITFDRFQDGVVYLHMKGSCAGCPSSTATLKMGIENRLKEAIPEVVEVVAV